MSAPSRDVRAVVEAVDRLTTQVKRLADAKSTPVAVAADAPTTTADDGPRCDHRGPHPGFTCAEVDATQPYFHVRWEQEQQAPTDAEDAQRAARREQLHNLLARLDRGGLLSPGDCTRLRVLVDTEVRAADTARAAFAHLAGTYKAERRRGDALAEERNQAWAERDAEQARLRDLLRSENQRANKAIDRESTAEQAAEEARAELEQAQAALERVRATLQTVLATFTAGAAAGEPVTYQPPKAVSRETFELWAAALDGTEQPTTEA